MYQSVSDANRMLVDLYPLMDGDESTGKSRYRVSLNKGLARLYFRKGLGTPEEIISYRTVYADTPLSTWLPEMLTRVLSNEHTLYLMSIC